MNEYDNILNRIVDEFYDTGKVVLNELDLTDELLSYSSEQQTQLKRELSQNLITAKRTFQSASYKSSKENYENFLNNVENLIDKTEYENEINIANERLVFIGNLLKHKETELENTEFEKSIDNLEDLEIGTKTSKTLYDVNTDKIIEIFQSNECLYNELINNNSKIREFIIKHFKGEYCSKTDNICLKNNNKFINHINKIELNEKDKKSIIINLTRGGTMYVRKIQGLCEVDPMGIINSNITTTHSKESGVEKSLPENSITKEVKVKLNKSYSIIQNIISEIEKNEVIKQIPSFKNVYSDLMRTITIYTKGAGENKSLTTKVQKDIEGSLNMVIYDLYQLYLLVQSFEVYGDKEKKEILKIINNISKQINDKEKLSENFFEIRKIRNQKYEKSFACDGYFEQTKGGNSPKIIDVNNNNQYLMELITGATETTFNAKNIATEIYNLIDVEKIEKSLEKHDIKSNTDITLENGTVIPEESKIEVKLTGRYSDYHLSEFFGVYKNKPLDEYTDRYNQVITELKEMLKGNDKGIIQKIKDTTAGIFYENYMYTPIGNVKIEWSDMGQRSTEKRLSLRVTVEKESKISQWTKQNGNCNCEPFLKGVACSQNESTDRLDNIIENFFDTGKVVLNERTNKSIDDKDDYEVLRNFWLKYKQLPRHNRLRYIFKDIKVKDLNTEYPKNITLSTWIQYIGKENFNNFYKKLLNEFNLYEENEDQKRGGKNYVVTDSDGNKVLLRSVGEYIAFNTFKHYGLDKELEIDSNMFRNDCGDIHKEIDFILPNKKIAIEVAGMSGNDYYNKLESAKRCIEEKGWVYEYIRTKGKPTKYIHDEIVRILNINNSNYDFNEIIKHESLNKEKIKQLLNKELKEIGNKNGERVRQLRINKYIKILYGDEMVVEKLKTLHREKIKDFLNGDMNEKQKNFYLLPYLEIISEKHKCEICGKYKSEPRAKLCNTCSRINRRKTERPSCEELLKPNINKSQIGRDYGVSDTAVRKWIGQCKKEINNDDELDQIIENFFDTGKFVI